MPPAKFLSLSWLSVAARLIVIRWCGKLANDASPLRLWGRSFDWGRSFVWSSGRSFDWGHTRVIRNPCGRSCRSFVRGKVPVIRNPCGLSQDFERCIFPLARRTNLAALSNVTALRQTSSTLNRETSRNVTVAFPAETTPRSVFSMSAPSTCSESKSNNGRTLPACPTD